MQVIVCVSSAASNIRQRRAIRRSWFGVKADPATAVLTKEQQSCLKLFFVVSSGSADLQAEQDEHGDMLLVDAPEGYENLWRKALTSLQVLEQRYEYSYYVHADDDSYVRLDLLLALLADSPRSRFYWGYIWDGTGNRHTAPIRNPRHKSHMPKEQYALDYYPPFASGCGFVLSRDLVQALLKQPLPDYRLLDPPFGIHLCGREFCVLPEGPAVPVHDERVRPYRGIPIFKPETVVQHYLTPEELAPYHAQVLECLSKKADAGKAVQGEGGAAVNESHDAPAAVQEVLVGAYASAVEAATQPPPSCSSSSSADELYQQLVKLGLLRR